MTCKCGQADECNGEYATHYPLQDGGMCAVEKCLAQHEHKASAGCWCGPTVEYKDPDTGIAVYVHKQVQ